MISAATNASLLLPEQCRTRRHNRSMRHTCPSFHQIPSGFVAVEGVPRLEMVGRRGGQPRCLRLRVTRRHVTLGMYKLCTDGEQFTLTASHRPMIARSPSDAASITSPRCIPLPPCEISPRLPMHHSYMSRKLVRDVLEDWRCGTNKCAYHL
jgi:hypothetical protein